MNFCSNNLTQVLELFSPPIPDFSFENACIGEFAQFTDESVANPGINIDTWSWDFDNTNTSALQNPTNIFNANDEYNVSLTVVDENDCTASIVVPLSAYATPDIAFTHTAICIEDPEASFNNLSTIDDGTIVSWSWDFGDTEGSTDMSVNHTYAEAGTYSVSLSGESDQGCVGTAVVDQYVVQVTADLVYDNAAGCSPVCIDFSAFPSTTHGAITDMIWDFDDGSTSSDQITNRCFNNLSNTDIVNYGMQYTAYNEYGCQASVAYEDVVEIWPIPLSEFDSESYVEYYVDPTFYFENTSIGAMSYYWEFGDGSVSTNYDESYEYEEPAIYEVALMVTSDLGCTDAMTRMYELKPTTSIFIPSSFTPTEDGLNDHFKPVVNGEVIEYEFLVYDRWGRTVFLSENPEESWNGDQLKVDTHYAEDEVYSWLIKVRFEDSTDVYEDKGTVVVFR